MTDYKKKAKIWIDANVHDGEDRSGCDKDFMMHTPDELQELIDDLLDDIVPEILKDQRERDAVISWKGIMEYAKKMRSSPSRYNDLFKLTTEAIRNAEIEK